MEVQKFKDILKDAEILINVFETCTSITLQLFLEPDEVSLYYKAGDVSLDIGVCGEGTYSYYYIDENQELFADDLPLGSLKFDEVISKLKALNTFH